MLSILGKVALVAGGAVIGAVFMHNCCMKKAMGELRKIAESVED